MARMNRNIAVWLINLLDIKPNDTVLEIGFGPGTAIGQMADLGLGRQICGIDYSPEMPQQATARNMEAIKSGRVDLRFGSVEHLPFRDNTFDKVFAINSMQVWPDIPASLREVWRVMKSGPEGSHLALRRRREKPRRS
jgi:ubiquinone/menaquinone biosynthesis C-methylase UbiE